MSLQMRKGGHEAQPGNSTYLCSFHIPKTGGTTFAYHAQKSMNAGAFLLHGPFSRADRLLGNIPQIEELSDGERGAIKIIHGHGANLRLAEAMTGRYPELMLILRNPYARFVSGYHHFNNERKDNALPIVTEEKYLQLRGGDFYAKLLLKHFEPLALAGHQLNMKNLLPILRSFKYFILTEHMDWQLKQISRIYGLNPGEIEARRINKTKANLTTETQAFDRWNEVDREIYLCLQDAAVRVGSTIENPFGYNPDILKSHLDNVWSKQTPDDRLSVAYDDLVDACKETLKLQAAFFKLSYGSTKHVYNPLLLREKINDHLNEWLAALPAEKVSVAHFWSGIMFMNEGDLKNAEDFFRESVRLNPKNDNSLARLAQILYRNGEKIEAVDYINRAMELRPERPINKIIYKAIVATS